LYAPRDDEEVKVPEMVVEASVRYMTKGHCPEWRLMFFFLLLVKLTAIDSTEGADQILLFWDISTESPITQPGLNRLT
jgi:hypothetical protein